MICPSSMDDIGNAANAVLKHTKKQAPPNFKDSKARLRPHPETPESSPLNPFSKLGNP